MPSNVTMRHLVLATALTASACGESQVLSPAKLTAVQNARQMWQAQSIHSYSVEFRRECVCLRSRVWVQLTIENDAIVEAVVLETGEQLATGAEEPWLRVEDLFDRVERLAAKPPGGLMSISVGIDANYGYLAYVSFISEAVSDYARQDNYQYWMRNLTPR